jgi:hypothetical protein
MLKEDWRSMSIEFWCMELGRKEAVSVSLFDFFGLGIRDPRRECLYADFGGDAEDDGGRGGSDEEGS